MSQELGRADEQYGQNTKPSVCQGRKLRYLDKGMQSKGQFQCNLGGKDNSNRTKAVIIYEIPGITPKGFVYISFKPFTTTPQIVNSPILQRRKIKRLNNLHKAGKQQNVVLSLVWIC